ncbi:TerD family protein [Streptomyces sp. NPDC059568]|uniref:TerD family protein n=1 Tax=Streptomyces sp. NPDC059568 TaxID=3346868 RepID=UPI003680361E
MTFVTSAPDMPDLRDYAFDWALVDVETSGLIARRDRVLSIAVVTVGPDGKQTGEFSTLLNPGCDPGPVHIHGLTAERLRGAPAFEEVAGRIGALLQDRVLVAHNAQFDYDFLAHEFARARLYLPVSQRLCTLALNRRVDPPTADMRLGTLAAHYGVPQTKAHDALDDTRVLAGILRASLKEAARLDLPLPLVACPPRQDPQFTPKPPKTPCAYRNPGKFASDGRLVQGMKIAITGDTATARAELVARSVAAGLNMVSSVSRYTSALVTNDSAARSAKARRALAECVPVIDERAFLGLLDDVRPGTPHEKPTAAVPVAVAAPAVVPVPATAVVPAQAAAAAPVPPVVSVPAAREPEAVAERKPLAGRRVLVVGGVHQDAAEARTRIVELGGAAAVNLSASVTDVVLLAGGEHDRRMPRITSLRLPAHDAGWLTAPSPTAVAAAYGSARTRSPYVLPRGGVIDLPDTRTVTRWDVRASWAQRTSCEIDVVAFIVDEDEQVSRDEDFVFYGAPESPNSSVRLLSDGPTEQTITIDLTAMPPAARKVVICAAMDGAPTFGDVGAVQITVAPDSSATPLAQAVLDAATTERTLLLAEIYRRGPFWRFRAVGQGYGHGLAALARTYGVDIAS